MGSINVSASAKMIIASPLRLIQDFTVTPGRRKNFDQMPHNGRNHAGLEEQRYFQPWAIYDTTEVQFLSNHDSHTAEIINCETGDSTAIAVSLKKSYRNKYFRADCKAKSLDGKLFIYFDEGIVYSDEDFNVEDSEFDFQRRPPEAPEVFTNPSTGVSIQQWKFINLVGGEALRLKIDFLHSDFVTSVVVPSAESGYTYDSETNALGILTDIEVELTEEDGLIEIVYNEKTHDLYKFNVNFNLDLGDYYVQLTCSTAGQSEIFKTEGLRVIDNESPGYKETVLFEIMHTGEFDSDDYFSFIYSGLNKIRLSIAQLYSFDPSGDINVFEGDTGVATKTRAVPHRSLNFHLENIPNWLSDKLNVLFSHDTIFYSGYKHEVTEYGAADHMEGNDIQHYDVVLRQVSDRKVSESNGLTTELTAEFNPDEFLDVPVEGDSLATTLETNVTGNFEVVSVPSGISVDKNTLVNDEELTITVTSNEGNDILREFDLSYRSVLHPTLEALIQIRQDQDGSLPANALRTNPPHGSALVFAPEGETKRISVQATGTYTIIISSGWTYEIISSTKVDITAPANSSGSPKAGTVSFVLDDDNDELSTLSMSQASLAALTGVSPSTINKTKFAGSVDVDIFADPGCSWQIIKPSALTWLSIPSPNGTGDQTRNLSFQFNSGGPRSALLSVRNINLPSNSFNISVYQAGETIPGGGPTQQEI